jgi:hypothetical protein
MNIAPSCSYTNKNLSGALATGLPLPMELAAEVFLYFTPLQPCQTWISIPLVCRKWRKITLDPRYWSCIVFHNQTIARLMLERSKNAPLVIVLRPNHPPEHIADEVADLVRRHAHHIAVLDAMGGREEDAAMRCFFLLLSQNLPVLRRIYLDRRGQTGPLPDTPGFPSTALECIALRGFHPPWTSPAFNSITLVVLQVDPGSSMTDVDVPSMFESFSRLSRLQQLHVNIELGLGGRALPDFQGKYHVFFPELRSFVFSGHPADLNLLLSCLNFPQSATGVIYPACIPFDFNDNVDNADSNSQWTHHFRKLLQDQHPRLFPDDLALRGLALGQEHGHIINIRPYTNWRPLTFDSGAFGPSAARFSCVLDISHGQETLHNLRLALATMPLANLQCLYLHHFSRSSSHPVAWSHILVTMHRLRILRLQGEFGTDGIIKALAQHTLDRPVLPALETLLLEEMHLRGDRFDAVKHYLRRRFRGGAQFRSLIIRRCNVTRPMVIEADEYLSEPVVWDYTIAKIAHPIVY